jgi:hypothetical protein
VLSGPGGARVTTPIEVTMGIHGFPQCGRTETFDFTEAFCDIDVTIPAGSPSGAWSVISFQLTNNVGLTQRFTGADLGDEPIQVTRNDIVSASDFALTPSQVNNWRETQTIVLGLRPAGVQSGLSTVRIHRPESTRLVQSPPIAADGTVSIPITMLDVFDRITVDGVVLTDGAGNVAAYGTVFGGPPLDLTTIRVPDTTRPVALTAVVTPSSRVSSDTDRSFSVDVTIDDDGLAPLTQYSVSFFNANGATVGGAQGSLEQPPPGGTLHLRGTLSLAPGTYTAAFTLFDKAGNFTMYGYPSANSLLPPNGPLVITIVDG